MIKSVFDKTLFCWMRKRLNVTSLNDGNWHHIALSRTGDTLYGFVDGSAVVSDSGGLSGNNSVAANSKFNFLTIFK